MWDIVTFNSFITQDVLIFFYYIGVVIIPIVLYYFRENLTKKFPWSNWIIFIIFFVCIELFWRMFFEMMIGYFDMHDYLYEISKKLS